MMECRGGKIVADSLSREHLRRTLENNLVGG
jgi:hypothetical protein